MAAVYDGLKYLGEIVELGPKRFESLDSRGRSLGIFAYRIDAEEKVMRVGSAS